MKSIRSRNISNSEVTTWLACRRMYWFAFFRNLAPKQMSRPLTRGTVGHDVFSKYVEFRLQGFAHDAALTGAFNYLTSEYMGKVDLDILLEVKFLITRYMDVHKGWPEWELLGTEERLDLGINDDLIMTIRYDLLVRDRRTGNIFIVDFKFTYDFWHQRDHDLNGQMPKYIQVMRSNGVNVYGGYIEEIRTRPLGREKASNHKNLWRRTTYLPSKAKIRSMIKQHIATSMEIDEYWNLSDSERDARTIPVLNKHGACKYCNFAAVCNSWNDGGDVETMLSQDYEPNTYGYNTEELLNEP